MDLQKIHYVIYEIVFLTYMRSDVMTWARTVLEQVINDQHGPYGPPNTIIRKLKALLGEPR